MGPGEGWGDAPNQGEKVRGITCQKTEHSGEVEKIGGGKPSEKEKKRNHPTIWDGRAPREETR